MMLDELSDINVDDNDLPVEMSDNILCSQDLAQFVMTQAFASKVEEQQPRVFERKQSSNNIQKNPVKSVLKSTIQHKSTASSISFGPPKTNYDISFAPISSLKNTTVPRTIEMRDSV